eukprot:3009826-Rhodomonas_salina.4
MGPASEEKELVMRMRPCITSSASTLRPTPGIAARLIISPCPPVIPHHVSTRHFFFNFFFLRAAPVAACAGHVGVVAVNATKHLEPRA